MAATYVQTGSRIRATVSREKGNWREKAGECFWFSVCLILFLILGPFAAPIVLGFIFSNHSLNSEIAEPETVVER